jgi:hypothetical protein
LPMHYRTPAARGVRWMTAPGAPVFGEFDDAGMRDAKSEPSMHQCALGKDIKSKISNVNGGRPGMRYYATGVE